MKVILKKYAAGLYLILCIVAMTGEPDGNMPLRVYLYYYGFVLINMLIATAIINKLTKTNKKNATTTNRNRV